MFFVLEGIDGCGKTTQAEKLEKLLAEMFGGGAVLRTREPGGWNGGEKLREFVLDGGLASPWSEFFFFMMDRCEHVERVIKPAISAGKIVVSDRYSPSTLAYQILSNPEIGGGAAGYITRLADAIGLPAPDAIFLLDIGVCEAEFRLASRDKADGFDERGRDFFERVREGYDRLMNASPGMWIKIDASRPEEEVFSDIARHVVRTLEPERK
ncbi:MAG: dTMP kinase [Synergistaceae bacterium]|jgi:dTMP kinase|nr:dTMP kinase [Synergistaceae bacterium]